MYLTKWKAPAIILALVLVIGTLLGATACGSSDNPTTTTTKPAQTTANSTTTAATTNPAQQTTTASQAHKVLKIGSTANFSTKEGLELKKWHDLFVKKINAAGGWKIGNDIYDLNIITYDSGAFDDAKSRQALEKLIYEDKVKIIIDTFMINDRQAAQIAQENDILLLGEGFQDDCADPKYSNYYRTTGIYFGRGMNFNIAHEYYQAGSRKLAFIEGNSEQSQTQMLQYGLAYKMAGFEVTDPVLYNTDTVDFGPIATKVISLGADSVCFPDAGSSLAINIMGALYDSGWKGTMFPSSLTLSDLQKIYAKVGSWCDGMLGLYLDPRGIPIVQNNPVMKGWLDAYTAEYGTFVESGCLWVGGFWFLKDAIDATQSIDKAVLQKYLDKSDHEVATLVGYAQLMARPDLQNFRTMDSAFSDGIAKAVNGKFEFYKLDTVMDQYVCSIKAYGLTDTYKKYWADNGGQPKFEKDAQYATFGYDFLDK